MRLWSIHPRYLDAKGLTACWREALLARKVLAGGTVGYRNHAQLVRFRALSDPVGAVDRYLAEVCDEAHRRGYRFDRSKIGSVYVGEPMTVTDGQLHFEREHLLRKLERRDPARWERLHREEEFEPHPLFRVTAGDVESWEKR